jgi:hypothetical protein
MILLNHNINSSEEVIALAEKIKRDWQGNVLTLLIEFLKSDYRLRQLEYLDVLRLYKITDDLDVRNSVNVKQQEAAFIRELYEILERESNHAD